MARVPYDSKEAKFSVDVWQTEESEASAIGMDTMGFMMEMPLLGILHFDDRALPTTPEVMLDGLLHQAHAAAADPVAA